MQKLHNIYKKVSKDNSKIYNFKSTATILFLFSKISYFFSPIFIILKVDPNKLTYFNFVLSLLLFLLIIFGNDNVFTLGICLYFLCLIIDFCDGSVARYYKITSFYGKFIDGLVDIFLKCFLILSVNIYFYKTLQNLNLLILGSIAMVLASFDTFILDRYSALVRWHNQEYKKKITSYIRKKFMSRLTFFYSDLFIILIGLLIFSKKNELYLFYNLVSLYFIVIVSALQSLLIHSYFSYKNLKFEENNNKK
jgi:phosphatidylglycerophosphate synthase